MKPLAQMCILAVVLGASAAAASDLQAGAFVGRDARHAFEGTIDRAVAVGILPDEGWMLVEAAGTLPPNQDAILVPLVDDGRIEYVATDYAIRVRAGANGKYAGALQVPALVKSVRLLLIAEHGPILDSIRVPIPLGPMEFLTMFLGRARPIRP